MSEQSAKQELEWAHNVLDELGFPREKPRTGRGNIVFTLRGRINQLGIERDHWKANHDEQVRRKQKVQADADLMRRLICELYNEALPRAAQNGVAGLFLGIILEHKDALRAAIGESGRPVEEVVADLRAHAAMLADQPTNGDVS